MFQKLPCQKRPEIIAAPDCPEYHVLEIIVTAKVKGPAPKMVRRFLSTSGHLTAPGKLRSQGRVRRGQRLFWVMLHAFQSVVLQRGQVSLPSRSFRKHISLGRDNN